MQAPRRPEKLLAWSSRVDRVKKRAAELTRADAEQGRQDLIRDERADPTAYAPFSGELAALLDELEILTKHRTRREDLLDLVKQENRAKRRQQEFVPGTTRAAERESAKTELSRIPSNLPPLLYEWTRRAIRGSHGLAAIEPRDAWLGEAVLRGDQAANPDAYKRGFVQRQLTQTIRLLSDLATQQRPGAFTSRGSVRPIADDL